MSKKEQLEQEKLRLMVFKSAQELGEKIDRHLLEMYGYDSDKYTFMVPMKEIFFDDGHLKVEIKDTVRGKDLYFLTDVENCSLTYEMRGFINHTSPNDLFTQLKDGIGACNCHPAKINVVMPMLYAGRQHRRNTRENLACGKALRELDTMNNKMNSFITFDAHDPGVEHAVFNMEFNNVYVTSMILQQFINDLDTEDLKQLVFVSPDNGATGRRNVYLNSFSSPHIDRQAGSFYKQRDYNNLVNGKYPVVAHEYCGNDDLEGRTAIVTDDMISSGGSMIDVIDELKERGVKKIYVITTYALFTKGIEKFDEYFKQGKLDGVYTSNLSYIPEDYLKAPWMHVCDCSKLVAQLIYNIHNDLSISEIMSDKSTPVRLLERKFQ